MTSSHDTGATPEFRRRVFAAARDELAHWGIDRFSLLAVAHRHGLDLEEIHRHWADETALIVDVLLDGSNRGVKVPDTGSLREDLSALAIGMAAYVKSGDGLRMQGTHLIGDPDLGSTHIRRTLWRTRTSQLGVVFDRARERGELHDDVDTAAALELLFAPINMRAMFTGEPIDEAYCRRVAELVYRAICNESVPVAH
jgi:Tetracyclin repressor-like, C-terminal domain